MVLDPATQRDKGFIPYGYGRDQIVTIKEVVTEVTKEETLTKF